MAAGSFNLSTPASHWAKALQSGDRRALSRLLTFAESSRSDQQALVDDVLGLSEDTGAFRIGVSGAPGAGKSTLVEALGTQLVDQGKSVGVLAVDPSSQLSGGSILADKTRMTGLSTATRAFVRPSPSGLGQAGISRYTSRSLALCERAGFDYVFLETVGVGQTELDAVSLVDCFIMVVSPSGGDELQGMKRGITEHADLLVVNKMDQDPALSLRTRNSYASALHLLRGQDVPTLRVSAKERLHLEDLQEELEKFCSGITPDVRADRRSREREREFWQALTRHFEEEARSRSQIEGERIASHLSDVQRGLVSASEAAHHALSDLVKRASSTSSRGR